MGYIPLENVIGDAGGDGMPTVILYERIRTVVQ